MVTALRQFQEGNRAFPQLLEYDALIAEGVMLNQSGSLMASFAYSGPDTDSLPDDESDILSSHINSILCNLGTNWSIQSDSIRLPATHYPANNHFPDIRVKINKGTKTGVEFCGI